MNDDLDIRLKALNDYLTKFNELQSMFKEFDNMFDDVTKNYKAFLGKIQDAEDTSEYLKLVLEEMEKGVAHDYKLKESLIKQEKK